MGVADLLALSEVVVHPHTQVVPLLVPVQLELGAAEEMLQTNKQTSKQTNKQTMSKQTKKQVMSITNKQTMSKKTNKQVTSITNKQVTSITNKP